MKYSEFYRMAPQQKESFIARMMPRFRALKKSVQNEVKEYILKNGKLRERYSGQVG